MVEQRRRRHPAVTPRPVLRGRAPGREATGHPEESARRSQILAKARDLFVRHGYKKTTIEDIATACGLVKAALYHYFPNKEAIFADVVRLEGERMLATTRDAVANAVGPRAKLLAMLKAGLHAVTVLMDELVDYRNTAEFRELAPLAASKLQAFLDQEAEILRGILDAGVRAGVFKKMAASPSVPFLIMAGLRGVQMHMVEAGDVRELEGALDTLLDLFLEGLAR